MSNRNQNFLKIRRNYVKVLREKPPRWHEGTAIYGRKKFWTKMEEFASPGE